MEHTPEEKIDELVITLELSQEAKSILEKLIKKWLVETEDKETMSRFIEKELKSSSVYPEA